MRRILLDIDNTITTPDYIIQNMANLTGKDYTGEETLESYNIGDVYGLTKQEDSLFWKLYGRDNFQNSKPNREIIDTLYGDIIKEDDKIYIITARTEDVQDITENWLRNHGIEYDELILVGKNSKIGFIEGLDIDVIIDDKPDLFQEIEVVKDVFPNSSIAKKIKDGTLTRYVVQYPYNKDVVSEYFLTTDGEIIKNK